MEVFYGLLRLFTAFRKTIGPDIKSKKLISFMSRIDSSYIQWSDTVLKDPTYLETSVRSFFIIYLLMLCMISFLLSLYIGKNHDLYKIVSIEIAFIFFIVFFGSKKFNELIIDLKSIGKPFLKIFLLLILLVNTILLFISTQKNNAYNFVDLINTNTMMVVFILILFISLFIIFKLFPFIGWQLIMKFVQLCVKQSRKQQSDELGHFLRYIALPPFIISGINLFTVFI